MDTHMKVQEVQILGETIMVSAFIMYQALLSQPNKRQSHLRWLALKTRTGYMYIYIHVHRLNKEAKRERESNSHSLLLAFWLC